MKRNVRRKPLSHQKHALSRIQSVLRKYDRAKYIGACGTGKTLIALRAAMALKPRTVVVFLPSLALIRQTMMEWMEDQMFNNRYERLVVCSDVTVARGLDDQLVTEEDLRIPITTDAATICSFLKKRSSATKVVFSTYHSATVFARGLPRGFRIDCGIMDEAHKTAGQNGKMFAIVLDDSRIPISKRIFFTATPRHIRIRKSGLVDAAPVYSMDDESQYGPTAAELPMRDAIEQGIISDYQVVISHVTSSDLRSFTKHGTAVDTSHGSVDTHRLTHILALKQALHESGAKKVFTFHATVDDARTFVHSGSPSLQDYLPDFKLFHINGAMSSKERDDVLEEFKAAERAIISNARVLTEGVNVPATDMVAFMSPKRSMIDIIQAVGRAQRQHSDKNIGYVMLPVFADTADHYSLRKILRESEYDYVWDVVHAIKEQDRTLASMITTAAYDYGKNGSVPADVLSSKLTVIGSSADVQRLTESVFAACIDVVGHPFEKWLGLLDGYVKKYGNCIVPSSFCYRGKRLGWWVSEIRHRRKRDLLTQEQIVRLDALGFVWNPYQETFERMMILLEKFASIHGHCSVPSSAIFENNRLGVFVQNLRRRRKGNLLTSAQIARLDAFGFVWDVYDKVFLEMYSLLKEYAREHGHCRIHKQYLYKGKRLGAWTITIRQRRKHDLLSHDHIAALDALGFIWRPYDQGFNEMIELLEDYVEQHGHCDVPSRQVYNGQRLGQWVCHVRLRARRGKVSPQHIPRLDALGFVWGKIRW